MANTFSQIYIQTVFAVSGRLSLITSDFKEELHKYITGIVAKQGQKLIRINGVPVHLHILIGLKPGQGRVRVRVLRLANDMALLKECASVAASRYYKHRTPPG
jgi:REP element-mobilizing transposase RayT